MLSLAKLSVVMLNVVAPSAGSKMYNANTLGLPLSPRPRLIIGSDSRRLEPRYNDTLQNATLHNNTYHNAT
jgi:hypothetical protein